MLKLRYSQKNLKKALDIFFAVCYNITVSKRTYEQAQTGRRVLKWQRQECTSPAILVGASLNIPKSKIVSVISKITMKMKFTTVNATKKHDATMCLALFEEMQNRIPTNMN